MLRQLDDRVHLADVERGRLRAHGRHRAARVEASQGAQAAKQSGLRHDAAVTPQAVEKQARGGKLLPVYLFVGDERLLRDRAIDAVRKAALGAGIAAFNEDKFTAGEATVGRIVSAARTVPMMAPKRFVQVRSLERWDKAAKSADDDAASDDDAATPLDDLQEYAKAPIDSTCVVLVATKLDGRRRLVALARKQGFLVECNPLEARELVAFVGSAVEERGHTIDGDTAALIAEMVGPELSPVVDAVERLSLFVGAGNPITDEAVQQCVLRIRAADTWGVVAAVQKRDIASALATLKEAYDPRDRGLPMLGAIAWSIRQLAKYKTALDDGASAGEAARRAAAFSPDRARELGERARALRPRDLERWLTVLAETDLALKGSKRAPDAVLEDMVTRLCRK
jgi:DNA polymerase-3 subunit delta